MKKRRLNYRKWLAFERHYDQWALTLRLGSRLFQLWSFDQKGSRAWERDTAWMRSHWNQDECRISSAVLDEAETVGRPKEHRHPFPPDDNPSRYPRKFHLA